MNSFKDSINEAIEFHVSDGSSYGQRPPKKDQKQFMADLKLFHGKIVGATDKGVMVSFDHSRDAENFKRTISKSKYYFAEETELEEALTASQRAKARQRFKRIKAKIKRGREKAKKKIASAEVIDKRAQKQAKGVIIKKLLKGKSKSDLSFSARSNLEKRVKKKAGAIKRIAKKLRKDVRKKDRAKFKQNKSE